MYPTFSPTRQSQFCFPKPRLCPDPYLQYSCVSSPVSNGTSAAPVTPTNGTQTGSRPRCSTCEQEKPDEWINWQTCSSAPYTGIDGESRILAHTSCVSSFEHPIMLRLQSSATIGNHSFWWFFVCNKCRFVLRLRGLRMERLEIEDRRVIIPLVGPGPHETRLQMWPSLSGQNWERNRGINELLGVGDYWSPPSSPNSSLETDPWADYRDDDGDVPD